MAKPILRAEDCARIYVASLDALEKVGVRVDDAEIIALLRQHGASDGATAETLRIPRELVRGCLSTCPPTARFSDHRGAVRKLDADRAGRDVQHGRSSPAIHDQLGTDDRHQRPDDAGELPRTCQRRRAFRDRDREAVGARPASHLQRRFRARAGHIDGGGAHKCTRECAASIGGRRFRIIP